MTSDAAPELLLARIRETFPALGFTQSRLIDEGDDNRVVVLDEGWIVRFPRNDEYRARFAAELNLLERVRAATAVPVPAYEHVAPDRSFGAYRMIRGDRLTPEIFRALTPAEGRAILVAMGVFLSALHRLPPATIAQPDGDIPPAWSGAQFAALYRGRRRAKIARFADARTLARFDAFHDAFAQIAPGVPRLIHDDLSDDHILVAGGRLAGIIDFSDASFGDAAIDFGWFWRLGEESVDTLFAHYDLFAEDRDLKRRSYWTFLRYLINQLYYDGLAKWQLTPERALAEIAPHLTALGF
ncbi:MAG: phosphotransferase [Rhizomicrobium sp.]